jgi:hypothetical protein
MAAKGCPRLILNPKFTHIFATAKPFFRFFSFFALFSVFWAKI